VHGFAIAMTRSRGKGENEITVAAKREAMRTGVPVGQILAQMVVAAKKAKEAAQKKKITQAQKYLRDRNRKKRRGRP
jgi:hypothetical protein